jgi:hypothetical protein
VEVEFAFIADAAEVASNQKLYVLGGGLEAIFAPSFPATHPHMSLVLKLKIHPVECDRTHALQIEFWDPDGQRLEPSISGEFGAQRDTEHPTRPRYVQLVVNLVQMTLPSAGDYDFHIVVNGQHLKTVPLYVHQSAPPEMN